MKKWMNEKGIKWLDIMVALIEIGQRRGGGWWVVVDDESCISGMNDFILKQSKVGSTNAWMSATMIW